MSSYEKERQNYYLSSKRVCKNCYYFSEVYITKNRNYTNYCSWMRGSVGRSYSCNNWLKNSKVEN